MDVPREQPTPMLVNILDQNAYYPIYTTLTGYLGIAEIVAISRTCKNLSSLYRDITPIQWNINKKLCKYSRDPRHFRSQMGRTNAVIAGASALTFFERIECLDDDVAQELVVMVQRQNDADIFERYLSDFENYVLYRKA